MPFWLWMQIVASPRGPGLSYAVVTSLGHEVVTAKDGEQALAMIAETLPDLVLLDIMMPKDALRRAD